MSEPINKTAISFWSALIGFQIGTAIFDYCKSRRLPLTGFEKMQNGEIVDGWRMALSYSDLCKKNSFYDHFTFVRPPLPINEGVDSNVANVDASNFLFALHHDLPDGRRLSSLLSNSLFSPDISTTLWRIVHDQNTWWYDQSFYLTERVIATAFIRISNLRQYRLILTNVVSKSWRILNIEAPPERGARIVAICHGDIGKRQLVVYFTKLDNVQENQDAPFIRYRVFYAATYEIPTSSENIETPIKSFGWQSISIPVGDRTGLQLFVRQHPPVAVIFGWDDPENIENHIVVSFDRTNIWRIDKMHDWLEKLRSTNYGSKLINALDSFASLPPPSGYGCVVPPLRSLVSAASGFPVGSEVFCATPKNGISRRFLNPPTLKRSAAESVFRSNPQLKYFDSQKVIGFDIFDGMRYDDEENAPVIYLP